VAGVDKGVEVDVEGEEIGLLGFYRGMSWLWMISLA
jgi:hypothetical protein